MERKTIGQKSHFLGQQDNADDDEHHAADDRPAIAGCWWLIHLPSPVCDDCMRLRRLSLIQTQTPPMISRTGHQLSSFQSRKSDSWKPANAGNSLPCRIAIPAKARPTATTASSFAKGPFLMPVMVLLL